MDGNHKVQPKTAVAPDEAIDKYQGLTGQQLIDIYRLMYLSRKLDDREILLKRQQKIFFQISGAGHEALLVAAGCALRPGYDWFYPYYRDRALCLALGHDAVRACCWRRWARPMIPNSGGRQMPSHWGDPELNIVTQSSPTGTQFLQAVGCAEAGRYFAPASRGPLGRQALQGDYRQFKDVSIPRRRSRLRLLRRRHHQRGRVLGGDELRLQPASCRCCSSSKTTSTPSPFRSRCRPPGGNISQLVANFPNFHFAECDGTDPLASYAALKAAVDYIRAGQGPAFVHGHVIRPYSHSLSDDEKLYRPECGTPAGGRARPDHALPALPDARGHPRRAMASTNLERTVDAEVQEQPTRPCARRPPAQARST